jgi:DNA integrity scanning protein DisA with diadenylate cyclase activity
METISREVILHAQHLARKVRAQTLVLYTDALGGDDQLRRLLHGVDYPIVLVTRSRLPRALPGFDPSCWVRVPDVPMTRAAQIRSALLVSLARQVLVRGDRVLFLSGADGSGVIDTLLVFTVGTEPELLSLAGSAAFVGDVAPEVFERVLTLATELAVQGREGRPVGALFVVGDSERVLAQSRSLVLNPFHGHPESERNVLDPALDETVKEFSALDGAFVIRGDGVVLSAGTQLVPSAEHPRLPGGLGTRHAAAAGITASTDAIAVCVSQSTGTVAVFRSGQLVTSIPKAGNEVRLAG